MVRTKNTIDDYRREFKYCLNIKFGKYSSLKKSSRETYGKLFDRFIIFLENKHKKNAEEVITRADCDDFFAFLRREHTKSPRAKRVGGETTRNLAYRVLQRYFDYREYQHGIQSPLKFVQKPQGAKRGASASVDLSEFKKLWKWFGRAGELENQLILGLLYGSKLKKGDFGELKVEDVEDVLNPNHPIISLECKSSDKREGELLLFLPSVREAVSRWIRREGKKGHQQLVDLDYDSFRKNLKRACREEHIIRMPTTEDLRSCPWKDLLTFYQEEMEVEIGKSQKAKIWADDIEKKEDLKRLGSVSKGEQGNAGKSFRRKVLEYRENTLGWIQRYKEQGIAPNEQETTIRHFIPLLEVLGWDPCSMEVGWEVPVGLNPNESGKDKSMDAVLFDGETPRLFIEVKRIQSNLSPKDIDQINRYGRLKELYFCILTNIQELLFYDIKNKRKIFSIDLDRFHDNLDCLHLLTREAVLDGSSWERKILDVMGQ